MALPRSTQLSLDLDAGGATLMLDPVLMRQLLITLVVQASDALQGRSGNVTLNLRTLDVDAPNAFGFSPEAPIPNGKYVCLELIESAQARVPAAGRGSVEAYFSARRSRGRALEALRNIVAVHGGSLAVRAQGESSAVLSLLFPVHRARVEAALNGGQAKRVLVADDDRSVRLMLTRMLQGLGFDVEAVETGQDAVEAVQREPARYALVFLDLAMPRLGGVKAHEQIQVIAPALPVALMSGYHENAARQVLGQGFTTFLQKPFTRADLNRKLQEALGTQG
jgi:CheY-like chemotaxis protein